MRSVSSARADGQPLPGGEQQREGWEERQHWNEQSSLRGEGVEEAGVWECRLGGVPLLGSVQLLRGCVCFPSLLCGSARKAFWCIANQWPRSMDWGRSSVVLSLCKRFLCTQISRYVVQIAHLAQFLRSVKALPQTWELQHLCHVWTSDNSFFSLSKMSLFVFLPSNLFGILSHTLC